jgi:hypothetical protein
VTVRFVCVFVFLMRSVLLFLCIFGCFCAWFGFGSTRVVAELFRLVISRRSSFSLCLMLACKRVLFAVVVFSLYSMLLWSGRYSLSSDS